MKPILLYGCELYCHENTKILETFYLQCLRRILGVSKTTMSSMIYGETGCTPLSVDIKSRALSFFIKLKNSQSLAGKTQRTVIEVTQKTKKKKQRVT